MRRGPVENEMAPISALQYVKQYCYSGVLAPDPALSLSAFFGRKFRRCESSRKCNPLSNRQPTAPRTRVPAGFWGQGTPAAHLYQFSLPQISKNFKIRNTCRNENKWRALEFNCSVINEKEFVLSAYFTGRVCQLTALSW